MSERKERIKYGDLHQELRKRGYLLFKFWKFTGVKDYKHARKCWADYSKTYKDRQFILLKFYEYIKKNEPDMRSDHEKNRLRKVGTLKEAIVETATYYKRKEKKAFNRDIYIAGYQQRNFEKLNAWVNEYNLMQKHSFKLPQNL